MSSTDTKCDEARMRRALYKLMWDRVEAGKKMPRPCPTMADKEVSRELYGILASAGVRQLSEGMAALVVLLLLAAVALPIVGLLIRLTRWIVGF